LHSRAITQTAYSDCAAFSSVTPGFRACLKLQLRRPAGRRGQPRPFCPSRVLHPTAKAMGFPPRPFLCKRKSGCPPAVPVGAQFLLTLEFWRESRTYSHLGQNFLGRTAPRRCKAVRAACPPGRFGYASLHWKMATLALWGVDETTVLRTVVGVEDALLGNGQFSLPGRGPCRMPAIRVSDINRRIPGHRIKPASPTRLSTTSKSATATSPGSGRLWGTSSGGSRSSASSRNLVAPISPPGESHRGPLSPYVHPALTFTEGLMKRVTLRRIFLLST
jgi:hypothetical protein